MRAAQLQVLGGTMAQVPADATAFTHRASQIMSTSPRSTRGPRTRPPAGLGRPVAAALGQEDSSAYVGFLGDEGRAHPPGLSAGHLAAAGSGQGPHDPANPFRHNHNIPGHRWSRAVGEGPTSMRAKDVLLKVSTRIHRVVFRVSEGRLLGTIVGLPVAELSP
jgi:hypothetical protein